jgi:uncharacterized delta-60 repeat protein
MLEQRDLMSAGSFDPSFGQGGRIADNFNNGFTAAATAVQSDGKIVIAGTNNQGFEVARLKADGTPDQSFGTHGQVQFNFSDEYGAAHPNTFGGGAAIKAGGVTIDSAGRIVFAGTVGGGLTIDSAGRPVSAGMDFAVARLNSDGSFDKNFGNNPFIASGKEVFTFQGLLGQNAIFDVANAVTIDAQGRILVAGGVDQGGRINGNVLTEFGVARLNTDGKFDKSFGLSGSGEMVYDFSRLLPPLPGGSVILPANANAVTIDSQGRIILAGSAGAAGDTSFAVARLNASDGSADLTFGLLGGQLLDFNNLLGNHTCVANAVAVDGQDRIVLAGSSNIGAGPWSDFAVARLNTDGSFDTTFGRGGERTFRSPNSFGNQDSANAVAIDPQGHIVLGGTFARSSNIGGDFSEFGFRRLNADGSDDTSFGLGGMQFVTYTDMVGGNSASASAMAIDPQGQIVAVGRAVDPAGNNFMAVTRLTGGLQNPTPLQTDLTGNRYNLTFDSGFTRQLVIQSEVFNADGTATISGTWGGQTFVGGTLTTDAAGNIHINVPLFGIPNNAFYGTISADGTSIDGLWTLSGSTADHATGQLQ